MGILRVLSEVGDANVTWDATAAALGAPSAVDAIREAERIFAQHRAQGATAFRVSTGLPAKRLDVFDPSAKQIIMIPRIVGG